MKLDSVRDLKASVQQTLVAPLALPSVSRRAIAVSAQRMTNLGGARRTVALGIARKGSNDYQLAVRVQRLELLESAHVEAIVRKARGEADVRFVGRLVKRKAAKARAAAVPWNQKRVRPLQIGTSIGHFKITAGTLGCFVTRRSDGQTLILSNNHVLANENDAKAGDAILQPGAFDGGKKPADAIGKLSRFVKLKLNATNFVDCAVASIKAGIDVDIDTLRGIGTLAGQGSAFVDEGADVFKVGRTTNVTHGRVTAFELDNVVVGYDIGDLSFDNQIEIEGTGTKAFSAGGDSGSLIVDADHRGIALLFAGGDQGGSNGKGLTYANPLQVVLDALKVDLAF